MTSENPAEERQGARRADQRARPGGPDAARSAESAERLHKLATDAAVQKIADRVARKADRVKAKAVRHADALDRLASQLDALEVWTRSGPGTRQPRFSRDAIAATAVWIADHEGFDALSMRRIAAELDAGTMTLYHYIRTKDELLALVTDAVLGEVILPADESLPEDWREAMTVIARRTRDALRRHPWILDIADDPAIGPNSVRHFDQSMQAVSSLDVDLATKLDIITVVDEYVFGYCGHERTAFRDDASAAEEDMLAYVLDLVSRGGYAELERLIEREGAATLWSRILAHAHDPDRFDRNLRRLLDGIGHDLPAR